MIAPDQRGYNLSDKPKDIAAYNLDELAADVIGLIDHFEQDHVYLVGHDWGGAVAWWAATKFPDRFKRMTILNVPHRLVLGRFLRTSLPNTFSQEDFTYYRQAWGQPGSWAGL